MQQFFSPEAAGGLNRRQRRFLELVTPLAPSAGAASSPTSADLCAAAGLPRATYFRWCHQPGFRSAVIEVLTRNLIYTSLPAAAASVAQAGSSVRAFRAAFALMFTPGSPLTLAGPPAADAAGGPTVAAARARRLLHRCAAAQAAAKGVSREK
ncbi:MAG TPA: hypothetical protein VN515_09650 [Terriglobales bacterium]|nr:hypothetical protein [Terriglobales bacterium]